MDIEQYIKERFDAEKIGKENAEHVRENFDNLLKFSGKFPKIIRIVRESFNPRKSFWSEYTGPIIFDKDGKRHQKKIKAKDTPTISSVCTILLKYLKYFCYLSSRESYFSLTAAEMKALESLAICLSVLSEKCEGLVVEEINEFEDMKELFPLDEQKNLDFQKVKADEIDKCQDSLKSSSNYVRKLLKEMDDYGTLRALNDAEEFEKTIHRQQNDAVAIICNDKIDSKEKLIQLQEYKHFIKDIIHANVATLDNGKTIDIEEAAGQIEMYIGNEMHVLERELIHYCNEVLVDPRDFIGLLILFHIFRLDSTKENLKLLSEGFRIHLDANIDGDTDGRFDSTETKDNAMKELCDCAKKVISYFEKYEKQMSGFEKEEYVEDEKLTGIWLNKKDYQYWQESGLNTSFKLFFYRDMDRVATKEDAKLIRQMSEKIEKEQEEIEGVNKIRTAVDKVAISLNAIFLLRQTLEFICNNDSLIPEGMEEEINKIRTNLYKAETRIVRVVYKKRSILDEGRKKYDALDYIAIENSENRISDKNEISLLKNMLKLSITDIDKMDEATLISKMNEYIRQARVFQFIDEEIDEISKTFCDSIQRRVLEREQKFDSIYAKLNQIYRPAYEGFRKSVQRYLGNAYTSEVQDRMENDFSYVLKALTTGEYLYWKYVPTDNAEEKTMDYSCVALEYYLALETLANLYLYFPYYVKNFKGNNWNDVRSSLKGGGSAQHMTKRNGRIKENLEIGTLGFFYTGKTSHNDRRSGIMSSDTEYEGLKNYIEFLGESILERVHEECLSLKSISLKRNESAHGGKPLAATAAKAAQGAVYIHDPDNDEAFNIEHVSMECRKLAIEIFEMFSEGKFNRNC